MFQGTQLPRVLFISPESAESGSAVYAFLFIYICKGDIFYGSESKQNSSHIQVNIVELIQLPKLLSKFHCRCS
jgi:hypothetical protein